MSPPSHYYSQKPGAHAALIKLRSKQLRSQIPLREREKPHPGGGALSCADESETRTDPPAGCGTTFELHLKAVELIWQPASCLATSKVPLNLFLNGSRRASSRPVIGEEQGRGRKHFSGIAHKRALIVSGRKRKFRKPVTRLLPCYKCLTKKISRRASFLLW
jgi:hypothetical protein